MSWDPWKPVGSKKKDSFFEPVTFDGGGASSWGFSSNSQSSSWSATDSTKSSSWGFSSEPANNWGYSSPTDSASSWAFSTPGNQQNSHWGFQQGYGPGHTAFSHESAIQRLESQKNSFWEMGDGSAWHFSNASRDLDIEQKLSDHKSRLEANSPHSSTWGWESTSSWGATSSFNPFSSGSEGSSWSAAKSNTSHFSPSSFNPFSSSNKKGWGWE